VDGDLCTIGGNEEFNDLVKSDLVKERKGTLRLKVIPKGERGSIRERGSARPSILHRRESSDLSGTSSSTLGAFLFAIRSSDSLVERGVCGGW